ncbi:hypothetical protein GCM10028778_12400 [Barrientosiimonas marina]|uniref:Polysaccharide deacetylase family protein n=1 Tax=Lentibacillus kimchii TaxID=1542911 RepID=A0ABW2UTK5_9BACI
MRAITIGMLAVMLALSACSASSTSDESQSDDSEQAEATTSGETTEDEQVAEDDADQDEKEAAEEDESEDKKDKQNDAAFKQKKPEYRMTDNYYIEPIDDADSKVVLLTIDDAPEDHAVEMAEKLKEMDAGAIFYINKMYVDQDGGKEKLEKIHDMGFPLGNHTDTHPNLSDLSGQEQRDELTPVYDQIEDITGNPVKFFRAPHGVNTDVSDQLAEKRDALVMNWSYGYDFKPGYEDAAKLTDIMLHPDPEGLLRDGAILLMHDRDWTNKALEDIVKGLRDQGYTILDPALLKTPQSPEAE